MAAAVRSRFFPQIALVLALLIIIGFSRTYYFRFLYDLPPMTLLMHAHGLVFTAWLVLFYVQARLIGAHRVALHMKLGIAAMAVAAGVFFIGIATALASAAVPRVRASGLTEQQFLAVPLTSILLFGTFVTLGILLRRRAAFHKRFMVLAMISVIGPAVARLIQMLDLGPQVQMSVVAAFVVWCLIHDWFRNRLVHPVFAIGGAVLVLSWPFRIALARSDAWVPISTWLGEMGTFLVS